MFIQEFLVVLLALGLVELIKSYFNLAIKKPSFSTPEEAFSLLVYFENTSTLSYFSPTIEKIEQSIFKAISERKQPFPLIITIEPPRHTWIPEKEVFEIITCFLEQKGWVVRKSEGCKNKNQFEIDVPRKKFTHRSQSSDLITSSGPLHTHRTS